MLKFGLVAFLLLLLGTQLLAPYSFQESSDLLLFVSAMLLGIAVLKVSLDLFLHRKKEEEDENNETSLLEEPEGKVFYDIEEYAKESRRRDKH